MGFFSTKLACWVGISFLVMIKMADLGMEKRFLRFSLPEAFFEYSRTLQL
jgi:hypothetical protein